MAEEIRRVSVKFLKRLFDSPGETYEPRGKFVAVDTEGDAPVFIAVDNTDGRALTEEFVSRFRATRWLNGRKTVNRFGETVGGR